MAFINRFFVIIVFIAMGSCSVEDSNMKIINEINDKYQIGLSRLKEDKKGVLAYNSFKKAEQLFIDNHIQDTIVLANIYAQLGSINYNMGNYMEAKKYLDKRYLLNDALNDSIADLSPQIDLAYTELALKNFSSAEYLIDELTLLNFIPDNFRNNIIELEGTFYEIIEDYRLAIDVFNSINVINSADIRQKEYSLARNYFKLKEFDEAKYHIQRLLAAVTDSTDIVNYNYYTLAAHIYCAAGEAMMAIEMYSQSEMFYNLGMQRTWNNKILELEAKFDTIDNERKILSLQKYNYQVLVFSAVLLILLLLLSLIIVVTKNKQRNNRIELVLKKRELEDLELVKSMMETSLTILPQYQEAVYSIIVKNLSQSSEALDNFNMLSTSIKQKLKLDLTKLINTDVVKNRNPVLSKMDEFTVNERIIFYLTSMHFSSSFIAKVLYTSTGSIRGMRARIRQKTEQSLILSEKEKNVILENISN